MAIDNSNGASNCTNCLVRKNTLFGSLSDEVLNISSYIDKKINYQAGEYLIKENDSINYSLCIKSGYLISGKYLENGLRQIFKISFPGDSIGFTKKNKERYNYFVQAITPVEVCMIGNDGFIKLLNEQPSITMRLIKILANNTKIYEQHLLNLGRKSATQALAYLIIDIHRQTKDAVLKCGSKNLSATDSDFCFFPLSQEDMADFLGLTKVHISRIISEFKKNNLIKYSYKKIKILDEKSLAAIGGA